MMLKYKKWIWVLILVLILIIFSLTGGLVMYRKNNSVQDKTIIQRGNDNNLPKSSFPEATQAMIKFDPGIYYRLPNKKSPEAVLSDLNSTLEKSIVMSPVDFDIHTDKVVYATDNQITTFTPAGNQQQITINGLYQIARPTLSPDGTKVAVQATPKYHPAGEAADFRELGIYVVDLITSNFELISTPDSTGASEAPEWFHTKNQIAYSSFSPINGVHIHIYNLDNKKESLKIPNAGALHISLSKDDRYILNSVKLTIYDVSTGDLIYDLKEKAIIGLESAGFTLDTEHDGLNNQGGFPLDGDFSPDGSEIIFDGAVKKNGIFGMVICRIGIDGSGFQIKSDLIEVNPAFSNNNNFSQINPIWLD